MQPAEEREGTVTGGVSKSGGREYFGRRKAALEGTRNIGLEKIHWF